MIPLMLNELLIKPMLANIIKHSYFNIHSRIFFAPISRLPDLQIRMIGPLLTSILLVFCLKGNRDVFLHRESNVRPHKEEVTHITLVRPWGRSRYFMPCSAKWRNDPLAPLKERVNSALGITLKCPEKQSRQKVQSSLIGLKLNGS